MLTTSFNSLGMGNGFPLCPQNVDVSGYDMWITLGGTEKGSVPTAAEIALSRVNAMNLFWNLYQVNLTATTNSAGTIISDVNAADDLALGNELPRERVCSGASLSDSTYFDFGIQDFTQDAFTNFYTTNCIVRMVNADGDFLGYGINSSTVIEDVISGVAGSFPFGIYLNHQDDSGEVLYVFVCSYGDTPDPIYGGELVYTSNLEDIPLLCCVAAILGGTLDAVNLSVSSLGLDGNISLSLDSLEFYTYP